LGQIGADILFKDICFDLIKKFLLISFCHKLSEESEPYSPVAMSDGPPDQDDSRQVLQQVAGINRQTGETIGQQYESYGQQSAHPPRLHQNLLV